MYVHNMFLLHGQDTIITNHHDSWQNAQSVSSFLSLWLKVLILIPSFILAFSLLWYHTENQKSEKRKDNHSNTCQRFWDLCRPSLPLSVFASLLISIISCERCEKERVGNRSLCGSERALRQKRGDFAPRQDRVTKRNATCSHSTFGEDKDGDKELKEMRHWTKL